MSFSMNRPIVLVVVLVLVIEGIEDEDDYEDETLP